jgi:hypothetical protein
MNIEKGLNPFTLNDITTIDLNHLLALDSKASTQGARQKTSINYNGQSTAVD